MNKQQYIIKVIQTRNSEYDTYIMYSTLYSKDDIIDNDCSVRDTKHYKNLKSLTFLQKKYFKLSNGQDKYVLKAFYPTDTTLQNELDKVSIFNT